MRYPSGNGQGAIAYMGIKVRNKMGAEIRGYVSLVIKVMGVDVIVVGEERREEA